MIDIDVKSILKTALYCAVFYCVAVSAAVDGDADVQLDAVMAEYWEFKLADDPLQATRSGITKFNDRLPSVTVQANADRLQTEKRLLARSRDIDRVRLSKAGRVNAELFEWVLADSIRANELDLSRIPFNTFSGFFMETLTAHNGVRMLSVSDYEDYLARLADIPRYFDENLANMSRGAQTGFVLPKIVIDGVLPTVRAQVKSSPEDSTFYDPLRDIGNNIPEPEKLRLQTAARRVISAAVMPAFAKVASYLENSYQPSESIAAERLPGGRDFYAFQIKRYTTVDGISPDDIHDIGLREVRRIKSEMLEVIAKLNFDGDFRAFGEFLRTDSRFYPATADALLKEAAYVAKRIDYVMPGYFGVLPRQSYGVVPVPDEIAPNYTTGAYHGAPPGGAVGGAYWINTYALDQRPLYELPALTLHEAVPGHHHQAALAQEMQNVPEFRKDLYFSAFGEGWALYAEKLGVEMGIYRDGYEHFGRLSYEMWRACRLVIDTGIHSKDWTRQQAIDFLADNTSLSQQNVRAEVDRYIAWPGQALSYKLGELKIWDMRRDAEKLLGAQFDLREFHDVVLRNGALPLAMLEAVVRRYVDSKLGNR